MNKANINFAELSWDESNTDVRSKSVVRNGKKLRLVEFTDKFIEHEWCTKRHIGYVLNGEMEIIFPDRVESFKGGDGIFITAEEGNQHKAKVISSVVRLILVEEG